MSGTLRASLRWLALALLAFGAACAPGVAGPGRQQSDGGASPFPAPLADDQQVTITFENYNLASAGIGREATLKMLDEFHHQHPNVTVDAKATADQQMFSTVQAEVVAGTPPDLAQLLLREWDQNIESLPVKTLSEIVPPEELQAHLGGTYPIHPRALKLTERGGKLQGLPYVFSTPTLFYNAALFKAAGLDPDAPPTTWDEVRAAARMINERTHTEGLYITCIENDWCAQGVALSNGGRVMTDDRSQIQWAEPASLDVYRFWRTMVQEGTHSRLSADDSLHTFQAGKLGMLLHTAPSRPFC